MVEAGFTLVELMVVVAIIGIASAAVVWTLPDQRGRLRDEAARLAVRANAARDLAIVSASPVSLWVSRDGYGFDERSAGRWRALAEKPLRVERWGEGTHALVATRERIVFDTTGLPDRPATLRLQRDRTIAAVTVAPDGRASVAR